MICKRCQKDVAMIHDVCPKCYDAILKEVQAEVAAMPDEEIRRRAEEVQRKKTEKG